MLGQATIIYYDSTQFVQSYMDSSVFLVFCPSPTLPKVTYILNVGTMQSDSTKQAYLLVLKITLSCNVIAKCTIVNHTL